MKSGRGIGVSSLRTSRLELQRAVYGTMLFLIVLLANVASVGAVIETDWLNGGHSREINQVAFSPDGTLLASASDDATVKLWRLSDRTLLRTIRHDSNGDRPLDVWTVCFSPNGQWLAAGGEDGKLRIWEVATGRLVQIVAGETNNVRSVAFSSNGLLLASGDERGFLRLWRTTDWLLAREIRLAAGVQSVAFSPDNTLVAAALEFLQLPDNAGRITLWRVSDGAFLRAAASNHIRSIAFSPSGEWLVAAGARSPAYNDAGQVDLWRVSDASLVRSFVGHSNLVRWAAFSPNGETLATAGFDTTVKLWQVNSGAVLRSITNVGRENGYSPNEMRAVVFSPDGALLATGDKSDQLKLWRATDGALEGWLSGHSGPVKAVSLSADGEVLATGASGHDDTIRIWRTSDHSLMRSLPGYAAGRTIGLSSNGTLLAAAAYDGLNKIASLNLWSTWDGMLLQSTTIGTSFPIAFAFSPDAQRVAASSLNGALQLWSLSAGQSSWSVTNQRAAYALAYSVNGTTIACAQGDEFVAPNHTVVLRRATDGSIIGTLANTENAASVLTFSMDGLFVAGGGDYSIGVWRVSDGTLAWMRPKPADGGVAFSSDGQIVVSAGGDALRYWRASDGRLLHTVERETARILALSSTWDSSRFAYGREDATVIVPIWPVMFTRTEIVNDQIILRWAGGRTGGAAYQVQSRSNLTSDTWHDVGPPTYLNEALVPITGSSQFFRVVR